MVRLPKLVITSPTFSPALSAAEPEVTAATSAPAEKLVESALAPAALGLTETPS